MTFPAGSHLFGPVAGVAQFLGLVITRTITHFAFLTGITNHLHLAKSVETTFSGPGKQILGVF